MFMLFVLIVTAIGQRPVQQIVARIAAEPLRAGLVGLLAEILFVPVLVVTIVALAISIIGIPLLLLVPFAIILLGSSCSSASPARQRLPASGRSIDSAAPSGIRIWSSRSAWW